MNDLQAFSGVVGTIYDSALKPENWGQAIEAIACYVGSDAVAIDFMDLTTNEPVAGFSIGHDPAYRRSLIETYVRVWMLQSQFHRWPVGQPRHLDEIVPRQEFLSGRFYREWCRPQGHADYIGLIAFADPTRFVKMTNARLESRGPYSREAIERFRLLAPHICRSVAISNAFRLQTVRAQMLETTLDSLTVAVYLTDADCGLLYANAAAEALLRDSEAIDVRNGRLVPALSEARARLQEAVRSDHTASAASSRSIALPEPQGGEGLAAFILPLTGVFRSSLAGGPGARAAIVVRRLGARLPQMFEAAAELFGLTAAEMRVAEAIAQGLSLQEAADILGLSRHTVKAQLGSVFTKTGTSRQSQLVSLLLASANPMDSAPPRS